MSAPTVTRSGDRITILTYYTGAPLAIRLTHDEAQALAEALTDAVDDAERVGAQYDETTGGAR